MVRVSEVTPAYFWSDLWLEPGGFYLATNLETKP